MGTRYNQRPQGLAILDERWGPDHLAANDGTANNSDYSEQGPRPGQFTTDDPLSEALIQISHHQQAAVDVVSVAGGAAERCGARWAWRPQSDTGATDWRGWRPPNQPQKWEAIFWSDSVTRDSIDVDVIPATQEPIAIHDGYFSRFDAATATWGTEVSVAPSISADDAACLCILPENDRILVFILEGLAASQVQISVYVSDDLGATWELFSQTRISVGSASGLTRSWASVAYQDGQILLVYLNDINRTIHLASSDLGATWTYVGDHSVFVIGRAPHVFPLPAGGFGLTAIEDTSEDVFFRRLGSAYEQLNEPTAAFAIGSTTATQANRSASWVDPDGTIWACLIDDTSPIRGRVAFSCDGGNLFHALEWGFWQPGTDDTSLEQMTAVGFAGGVCLLHNWTPDAGNEGGSVGAWMLGGWSNWEHSRFASTGGTLEDTRSRWSFGGPDAGLPSPPTTFSHTWLPLDLPDDYDPGPGPSVPVYTFTGSTPGVLANGRMELILGAGQSGQYERDLTGVTTAAGDSVNAFAEFTVTVAAVSVPRIALKWADGTDDYNVHLQADTAGFTLRDPVGAVDLVTEAVDMTAGITIEIRLGADGSWEIQWRPRGMASKWSLYSGSGLVSDIASPAANPQIFWGKFSLDANATTSHWYQFHAIYNDEIGQTFRHTGIAGAQRMAGRWLASLPTPIPDIGTDARWAFLALLRGPVGLLETHSAAPAHDYPIEAAFPTVGPSPDQPWRSVDDTADQIVAINPSGGLVTHPDGAYALCLAVARTNVRKIILEGLDLGLGWQTLGTYDGGIGFTGLTYDLAGDLLTAGAGSADAGRFTQHQEFRGGNLHLTDTGGPFVRGIASHPAGRWHVSTRTVTPHFRLTGATGTEDATGTVDAIVAHSGALVVPLGDAALTYARYRIRIVAADNPTAEGHFQIGSLFLGAVTVTGRQWGRGWSRAMIPRTTTRTSTAGTIRRKREGRSARRWVMSWQDGQDLSRLRQEASPDYLAADPSWPLPSPTRPPLAALDDVWTQLEGVIIQTRGTSLPVVGLADIPTAPTTITDPTLWILGLLTGTIQANNVLGTEGGSEMMRVESVTIEELV